MSALPVPTAERINHEHELARRHAHDAVAHAVRCGQLLLEAKQQLQHGEFMAWVKASCAFRYSTAARYMTAARQNSHGVEISALRQLFRSGRVRVEPEATASWDKSWFQTCLDHLDEAAALEFRLEREKRECDELMARLADKALSLEEQIPYVRRLGQMASDHSLIQDMGVLRLRMQRHLGKAFRMGLRLSEITGDPAHTQTLEEFLRAHA